MTYVRDLLMEYPRPGPCFVDMVLYLNGQSVVVHAPAIELPDASAIVYTHEGAHQLAPGTTLYREPIATEYDNTGWPWIKLSDLRA